MGMVKELEHGDPLVLRPAEVPGGDPAVQAKTYVEELITAGLPVGQIIQLFHDPCYIGTYHLTRVLGSDRVVEIIEQTVSETPTACVSLGGV